MLKENILNNQKNSEITYKQLKIIKKYLDLH